MTLETPVYVGIENEFQLMRNGEIFDISNQGFNVLLKKYEKPYFRKAETAIRTCIGSSIYIDQKEPEVSTPPAPLEKGVATKVTKLLYLARKELLEFFNPRKNLELIGYSMHWNISRDINNAADKEIMQCLAVPYSLFCLNPTSIGTALISKDTPVRWEWRGDHIFEEDQIKAFLTLFIGTMSCFEANQEYLPIRYATEPDDEVYPNLVTNGRESKVDVTRQEKNMFGLRGAWQKEISAQDYLEIYYHFFKKGIEAISTKEELKNLEDFITGKKKLEVDKKEKYDFYRKLKEEEGYLKYHKSFVMPADYFKKTRLIPTKMAKHLTRYNHICPKLKQYVKQSEKSFPFKVKDLSWGELTFFEYVKDEDNKTVRKDYVFQGTHYYEILEDVLASTPKKQHRKILRQLWSMKEKYPSLSDLRNVAEYLKVNPSRLSNDAKQALSEVGLIKEGVATPVGQRISGAILGLKIFENSFLNRNFQLSEEHEKKIARDQLPEKKSEEEKEEEPVQKKGFFQRLLNRIP